MEKTIEKYARRTNQHGCSVGITMKYLQKKGIPFRCAHCKKPFNTNQTSIVDGVRYVSHKLIFENIHNDVIKLVHRKCKVKYTRSLADDSD
jgi:hypothetical protein